MKRVGTVKSLLVFLTMVGVAHAATFNSAGDGDFYTPSTWGGTTVPGLGDYVTVKSGHTVTFSDGCAFTNGRITVSSGGVFAMSGGAVTGTAVIVNGTFRHSGGTHHGFDLTSVNLNGHRPLGIIDPEFLLRTRNVADQRIGRYELGINHIRSELFAQQAEGRIGHILHRSQEQGLFRKCQVGDLHTNGRLAAKVRKKPI